MAERSKLTLETLRQLAREHLGAGYSRLTRSQLVEALRKVVPKLVAGEDEAAGKQARGGKKVAISDVEQEVEQLREASLRKKAEAKKAEPGARAVTARRVEKKAPAKAEKPLSRGMARVKSAIATIAKEVESRRRAAKPAEKPPKKAEPKAAKAPEPEKAPEARPEKKPEPVAAKPEPVVAKPEPVVAGPEPVAPKPEEEPRERPKVIARSTIERAPEVMAAWLRTEREVRAQHAAEESPDAARPFPAEPVVEGFFVARVAGRGEARRHHLTDEYATGAKAEAQAPSPYGGRRIFLLPRDPAALFVYWDALAAGIDLAPGERLVVRILRGEEPVRELTATELSHGYYVEGLTPGATYRAQAFAVGPRGERVVDASGLPVVLPHIGEPADHVRFLRVPVTAPLPHLREFLRSGHAQFAERSGKVLVTVPMRTWRESGVAWAFTLSGSGSGRWLREGEEVAVVEEVAVREWEEAGKPRVEGQPPPREMPSSLSGAGRVSSPRSGWGRK